MSSKMPSELTDRIIDFLWDSQPDIEANIPTMLPNLPNFLRLRTIMIGSFPPSLRDFPILSDAVELSLQHTKFPSRADFMHFLSKFTGLRRLELDWIALDDQNDSVGLCIPCDLECFTVKGAGQNPGVLAWLSTPEYAPRTRALSLYLPYNEEPALGLISKFFRRLNGHLRYLRLDVYDLPNLRWSINLLELGSLTSLQRLRIGHGIYFYPPETPFELGTYRISSTVLEIALRLTSTNRLDELIFDVDIDISPNDPSSTSDSRFRNILTNSAIEQIPNALYAVYVLDARQRVGFSVCPAALFHHFPIGTDLRVLNRRKP
ncbi:hypothetical protein B0H13DRAFT_1864590 [Mycena leptocephala]|nr:hypothetical protein B0H13DRAFT_1864590 [Mycena leptocephala]